MKNLHARTPLYTRKNNSGGGENNSPDSVWDGKRESEEWKKGKEVKEDNDNFARVIARLIEEIRLEIVGRFNRAVDSLR